MIPAFDLDHLVGIGKSPVSGLQLSATKGSYGSIAAVHDHGYRHADLFAILGLISHRLSDLMIEAH